MNIFLLGEPNITTVIPIQRCNIYFQNFEINVCEIWLLSELMGNDYSHYSFLDIRIWRYSNNQILDAVAVSEYLTWVDIPEIFIILLPSQMFIIVWKKIHQWTLYINSYGQSFIQFYKK